MLIEGYVPEVIVNWSFLWGCWPKNIENFAKSEVLGFSSNYACLWCSILVFYWIWSYPL